MDVKLVFDGWRDNKGNDIYGTIEGIELSMGDFHSGTIFPATIEMDRATTEELRDALEQGYRPVFYIVPAQECA